MTSLPPPASHGILVVDKPPGCTSHDVVAWARRALRTREVGHAGTLDPAAIGVLVLLIGDATRLSSFLTSEEKEYEAVVRFGAETTSLDAEGEVVATGPAQVDTGALRDTLAAMVGPMSQVPPRVSAIKVDGVASHARVRRGEVIDLPPRDVTLCAATLLAHDGADATVRLRCSKGFYVRALARDLAARLGTVAHLVALKRTRSGCFALDESLPGQVLRDARTDEGARLVVRAAIQPIASLERRVPSVRVSSAAARDLRCGRTAAAPAGTIEGVLLALTNASDDPDDALPLGLVRCHGETLHVARNLPFNALDAVGRNTSGAAELA